MKISKRRIRMILRKINAGLSLLTTVLLMNHAIFLSIWMPSRCSIAKSTIDKPIVLAVLMFLHAALSIALGVISHKGEKKHKGKGSFL